MKDFAKTDGDKLDLKDMLDGENEGNLADFLHFEQSGSNTVLHVSSTGDFTAGNYDTVEDQQIVLENVSLSDSDLSQLIDDDTLIIDK